jgi:hypothetical protein
MKNLQNSRPSVLRSGGVEIDSKNSKVVRWEDERQFTYPFPSQEGEEPRFTQQRKKELMEALSNLHESSREKELDIMSLRLEIQVLKEHVRLKQEKASLERLPLS